MLRAHSFLTRRRSYLSFLLGVSLSILTFPEAESRAQELFLSSQTTQKEGIVTEVISTDTVILDHTKRVRLIGLKALDKPRIADVERDQYGFRVQKISPETPLEEQALQFVQTLLLDKEVVMEFDNRSKDNASNELVYLFLKENDLFVNAEILRHGYAHLHIQPPNLKYAEQLRKAYREARTEKKGILNE